MLERCAVCLVIFEEFALCGENLSHFPTASATKTVPVIVACGRLTQQKAQDTLLRAFALLRQTTPARLVILGEGEERDALLSLAQELGVAEDVSLRGVVDNPIAWFAKSDLFVLSSRCEG